MVITVHLALAQILVALSLEFADELIEDQDLAERMFELRKLRELVRNAETKRD